MTEEDTFVLPAAVLETLSGGIESIRDAPMGVDPNMTACKLGWLAAAIAVMGTLPTIDAGGQSASRPGGSTTTMRSIIKSYQADPKA
jgi:hypothetical protein